MKQWLGQGHWKQITQLVLYFSAQTNTVILFYTPDNVIIKPKIQTIFLHKKLENCQEIFLTYFMQPCPFKENQQTCQSHPTIVRLTTAYNTVMLGS
jgi:hypothetical protein